MEFQEKFIGFIDILGFKELVARAERGEGMPLPEILALLPKLGRTGERQFFERYGPKMCPAAARVRQDLDFYATQVSDCVIMSAEVSPAGGINLVNQAWLAVAEMLNGGLLCRGYITRGKIHHSDTHFLGTGYQKAYHAAENNVIAFRRSADERGTPFVEIDPSVRGYLERSPDPCVKEMFGRLVQADGTVAAIYPFKQFCAKFAITGNFNPAEQKASNQNLRTWLQRMKATMLKHIDHSNAKAVAKSEHYLAALNEQLAICDRMRPAEGLPACR